MVSRHTRGILVTGGGTFLGDNIASALLAEGAKVSLLVRPGTEEKLGPLAQSTRWSTADIWHPASLRGQARFHSAVIHTVGSLKADPSQGLSHQWLNFISARNVADMCVRDGVEHMILISGSSAPWISRGYIRAKREAENYMQRLGLGTTVIRAPLVYVAGSGRPLFYRMLSVLGAVPPLSWLYLGRIAPMRIETLARGVALVAISEGDEKSILYARDLKRRIKQGSGSRTSGNIEDFLPGEDDEGNAFGNLAEDLPFGWSPEDAPH